jgi:hypothetical protein
MKAVPALLNFLGAKGAQVSVGCSKLLLRTLSIGLGSISDDELAGHRIGNPAALRRSRAVEAAK